MSTDQINQVSDESSERAFFTILPNIIFRLGLSSGVIGFYSYLKQIAGEKGGCWRSIPTMARECNITEDKVKTFKKELSKPFPQLKGQPLIKIKGNRKKEDGNNLPDLITIVDIWNLNCNGIIPGVKNDPTPGVKKPPRLGVKIPPKEERYKNNPLKKNDNVSQSPKGNALPSPKTPTPNRDRSSFLNENKIVPFDPETYTMPNGQRLSQRCVRAFKKYKRADYAKLLANIEYFEQRAKKGDIEEQEKYLQNCINKNYAGKLCLAYQNKLWLEFLIIEHNLRNVKLLKTVAVIRTEREGDISVKFDLPEATFEDIMKKYIKEIREVK